MGSCNNCHKKIMYNKYKHYRKEILCVECYNTRLERKAARITEQNKQAALAKIAKPTKKVKKKATKPAFYELDKIEQDKKRFQSTYDVTENETEKTSEDSR